MHSISDSNNEHAAVDASSSSAVLARLLPECDREGTSVTGVRQIQHSAGRTL